LNRHFILMTSLISISPTKQPTMQRCILCT